MEIFMSQLQTQQHLEITVSIVCQLSPGVAREYVCLL